MTIPNRLPIPPRYISVCDILKPEQVIALQEVFQARNGPGKGIHLAIGLMTSYKVLNGDPTRWRAAFPHPDTLASLCLDLPRVYNVLHYVDFDPEPHPLFPHLSEAIRNCGPHLHSVQLDMCWPDAAQVRRLHLAHPDIHLIVQIGREAFAQVGYEPTRFLDRIAAYTGSVSGFLLDLSMGEGRAMEPEKLLPFVRTLERCCKGVRIIVAGGLGPGTTSLLSPILNAHPGISCDAQGKLRASGHSIDPMELERAIAYITEAINTYPQL